MGDLWQGSEDTSPPIGTSLPFRPHIVMLSSSFALLAVLDERRSSEAPVSLQLGEARLRDREGACQWNTEKTSPGLPRLIGRRIQGSLSAFSMRGMPWRTSKASSA